MDPYEAHTRTGRRVIIRPMNIRDVDGLVTLNKLSYPTLAEDNIVWSRANLLSQVEHFPDGQLVVEHEGELVGAAHSLVVTLGPDPYRNHTWAGITDNGNFTNHDPAGDTLYGADVAVHPDWRSQGIGGLLYDARRRLCRALKLRRIVLGGRLYNYGRHAKGMSAEEYARRVEAGELRDQVLSFQLREGFALRKVMPSYLRDRRSRDFATFLEWANPEWRSRPRTRRKVRISCVQYEMRRIADFDGFARQVTYFVDVAAGYRSDFVVFPELMSAQLMSFIRVKTPQEAIRHLTEYSDPLDELFSGLAAQYNIAIVGGSTPVRVGDHIENIATLYLQDGQMHRQPKLHITPNERRWWQITGGDTISAVRTPKATVGIAICYDIEFPEVARTLQEQGAEIIFVPFCTDDRQAYLRVRYCAQARAIENAVYVALAGNVGNLPDVSNMDIQYAQSAVLTPSDFPFGRDGIQVEADINAEAVITCDLDLDALAEAYHTGSVTPRLDRRTDLFQLRVLSPANPAKGSSRST